MSTDRSKLETDLSRARWRKSSYSNNGGDCVEMAKLQSGSVGVRDSKSDDLAALISPPTEFAMFLKGIKAAHFR